MGYILDAEDQLFKRIQDPITTQFPLILAIEPRLLPPAVENGFRMDYKVLGRVTPSKRLLMGVD